MSSLKTQLSVQQIQLGLRNSDLFNRRSDIIVPNLSWSILPYEADLIGISRSGQVQYAGCVQNTESVILSLTATIIKKQILYAKDNV